MAADVRIVPTARDAVVVRAAARIPVAGWTGSGQTAAPPAPRSPGLVGLVFCSPEFMRRASDFQAVPS
jgi:hypothetical protein